MGWLTMDTLRPRWDAKRGERSVVVKKTQLGQGLFVTTRVLESYEDAARLPYDVVTEQTRV